MEHYRRDERAYSNDNSTCSSTSSKMFNASPNVKNAQRPSYSDSYQKLDNNYICLKCSTKFNTRGTVLLHVKAVHYGIRYTCTECDRTCKQKRELKNHLRTKHQIDISSLNEKDFITHVSKSDNDSSRAKSKEGFIYSESYRKVNEGYICLICSLVFGGTESVIRHIRCEHYGMRYSCTECDKKYKQKRELKIHMQSKHHVDVSNLSQKDIVTHTSQCDIEDPEASSDLFLYSESYKKINNYYICLICSMEFVGREDITHHIRCEHYGMRYACTECGKQYKEKRDLKNHLKKKHRIEIDYLNPDDIVRHVSEIDHLNAHKMIENVSESESTDYEDEGKSEADVSHEMVDIVIKVEPHLW